MYIHVHVHQHQLYVHVLLGIMLPIKVSKTTQRICYCVNTIQWCHFSVVLAKATHCPKLYNLIVHYMYIHVHQHKLYVHVHVC